MLIRREEPADTATVHAVTAAAFARPDGPAPEPALVDALRADAGWLPALSLVAEHDGTVVAHILGTRAHVGTVPALAIGPLSVHPAHQRAGYGSALVHTLLGAADALGEPLVALLGDPAYYHRFGFRPADEFAITPPDPAWRPHFQVRPLTAHHPTIRGTFTYAEPFNAL